MTNEFVSNCIEQKLKENYKFIIYLLWIKGSDILKESIEILDISIELKGKLIHNKITTISKLVKKSKTELKNFGFLQHEINKINIELQLNGLSLKGSM